MKLFLSIFVLVVGLLSAQTATGPKAVTGKWHFVLDTEGGNREVDSALQQDGDAVTGKWGTADAKGTFTDGKLAMEFPFTSDEVGPGTMKIKGQYDETGNLAGTWAFNDYSGTFKAARTDK